MALLSHRTSVFIKSAVRRSNLALNDLPVLEHIDTVTIQNTQRLTGFGAHRYCDNTEHTETSNQQNFINERTKNKRHVPNVFNVFTVNGLHVINNIIQISIRHVVGELDDVQGNLTVKLPSLRKRRTAVIFQIMSIR